MSSLYSKINYIASIDNLLSVYIREYDISKANISILYKAKVIDDFQYNYFLNADKMERQIKVGLMQKDNPAITKILQEGIIEAKKNLFEANDIQDIDVLSIKNDAVFLINKIPSITEFDGIKFMCKNTYTSFYKLLNKEYYYLYDNVNQIENIDIKGMSEQNIELHRKYFLDFLLAIFNSAQTCSMAETIELLKSFYTSYLNKELNIEYYRRFDGESCFEFSNISNYSIFKARFLPEDYKDMIDISYNLKILSQLVKIYSGIYFQQNKTY